MSGCSCPSREQLTDYVKGKLDLRTHEGIDGHLDGCTACLLTVETLDSRINTVFSSLRHPGPKDSRFEDPAFKRLVAKAREIGSGRKLSNGAFTPVGANSHPCTVEQFKERLAQSSLLSADELPALWRSLSETPAQEDAARLARELVARGTLTQYQANALCAGLSHDLVLGNYVLLGPIGAGGMGRVFKAYHRRMRRTVALKILSPELLQSKGARARFQQEVEAVARLADPHIVAAFDADEAEGRVFLVMEHVDGRNLSDLVKHHGPLPIEQALDYTLQAARGLEHAHEHGLVHRDIKPQNLMIADCGLRIPDSGHAALPHPKSAIVKILDLGLARLHLSSEGAKDLTTSNAVMGTAAFMAPEQAANTHEVDHRADIYSLGCTLHYLLTGRPPYDGNTSMEVLFAHREQPIPSLRRARPECPPAVDALFRKMLAKRPEDRYPTMRAVIADLERLLEGKDVSTPTSRRRIVFASVALMMGVLFTLVLFHTLGGGFTTPRQEGSNTATFAAGTPTAEPAPAPATNPKTPIIESVLIQPGEFWMGSPDADADAGPDEKPRHRVRITQPFYLGKYEVTQAQYEEAMATNPSAFSSHGRHRQKVAGTDTRQYPVESVSWLDAVQFCNRLSERHGLRPYYQIDAATVAVRGGNGYRLPTEAEWEYACRAGTESRWSFGEGGAELDRYAWYAGNSGETTHPVGQRKPNGFGLHDMHGNVPEWCWDRYDPGYYKHAPESDPPGSGQGSTRVYRGGPWNAAPAQTRAAARETLGISYSVLTVVGLRVARNAEP